MTRSPHIEWDCKASGSPAGASLSLIVNPIQDGLNRVSNLNPLSAFPPITLNVRQGGIFSSRTPLPLSFIDRADMAKVELRKNAD